MSQPGFVDVTGSSAVAGRETGSRGRCVPENKGLRYPADPPALEENNPRHA